MSAARGEMWDGKLDRGKKEGGRSLQRKARRVCEPWLRRRQCD
jgi:hypothetical protein